MLFLLSRKLGAISFSNFGNGEIDVKSGRSSLVSYATIKWVHNLDEASNGGSDEYFKTPYRPSDTPFEGPQAVHER